MIIAESGSALSERALVKHAPNATKIRHLENRGSIGCPADYADAANLKLKISANQIAGVGDCASFQTSARSRPPEPMTRSFIGAGDSYSAYSSCSTPTAHFGLRTFLSSVNKLVFDEPTLTTIRMSVSGSLCL